MADIKLISKALLDTMTKATRIVLIKNGVDKNSDLVKSVEYEAVGESFVLLANDYYQYLSTGRRRRARKVPIKDLIKWVKDERIRPRAGQTINQLAFAIQKSIYKSGIKGHKYIKKVEETALDVSEEGVADIMEHAVDEMLAETFN